MSDEDRSESHPVFDVPTRTLLTDDANLAEALRRVAPAVAADQLRVGQRHDHQRGRSSPWARPATSPQAPMTPIHGRRSAVPHPRPADGVLGAITESGHRSTLAELFRGRAVERGVDSALSVPLRCRATTPGGAQRRRAAAVGFDRTTTSSWPSVRRGGVIAWSPTSRPYGRLWAVPEPQQRPMESTR